MSAFQKLSMRPYRFAIIYYIISIAKATKTQKKPGAQSKSPISSTAEKETDRERERDLCGPY